MRIWDAASGAVLATYATPLDTTYSLALSPDGALLAMAGERCESRDDNPSTPVPVMDINTGTVALIYQGHEGLWTSGVAWSPRGTLVASAGYDDCTLQVWDARTAEAVFVGRLPMKHTVHAVAWSPDGARVAAGTHRGFFVFDSGSGQLVGQAARDDDIFRLAWSPRGDLIAVLSQHRMPQIYDARTYACVYAYPIQPLASGERAAALQWSPDGSRIATGHYDGSVHIWTPPIVTP